MVNITEGATAPDFDMAADGGGRVRLSDFTGKALVLYFYPKDDTPGCTREAQDFTALASEFAAADVAVLGVSKDTAKKHDKFRDKYQLAVRLGSDEDGAVCEAYGVWVEKQLYGRTYMGIERATFLIDAGGTVRKVWRKVTVAGHAQAVLEAALDL